MLDAHRWLDDAIALRRLRDLLPALGARKQCIVLVGPLFHLPVEIEREAGRVALPLPSAAELAHLFERVLERRRRARPRRPEVLGQAIRGALGLTVAARPCACCARRCARAGALDARAVAEIVRDKRRALHRTPALTFLDDETRPRRRRRARRAQALARASAGARSATRRAAFGLPAPRGLLLLGVQGCGKSLSREGGGARVAVPAAAPRPRRGVRRPSAAPSSRCARPSRWPSRSRRRCSGSTRSRRASPPRSPIRVAIARVRLRSSPGCPRSATPVFVVATANDVTGPAARAAAPRPLRRAVLRRPAHARPSAPRSSRIHLRKRGRDPLQFQLEELARAAERLTGAELEQVVAAALYTAFAESRELADNDLANAIEQTVPLYDTYEERIKELRDWARHRARMASVDGRIAELFSSR